MIYYLDENIVKLFWTMLSDIKIVSEKVFAACARICRWLRSISVIFGAHRVGTTP